MNKETWKEVRGYSGLYEVSDLGRVRSLGRLCNSKNGSTQQKRPRIMTQEISIHGYCRVRLYDLSGKSKHFAVHRLVLEAFKGESELQVNHINEIKTDNRLENLEYVSAHSNCNHGTRNARISQNATGTHTKRVAQIGDDGAVLNVYESRAEAEAKTGVNAGDISQCCGGTRKRAGGYMWRNIKCPEA